MNIKLKIFIQFYFVLIFSNATSQINTFERGFGTPYDDEGCAICSTDSFASVVAGYTKGYNNGMNRDIYVVCFDSRGRVNWSSYHDDGLDETASGIVRYNSGEYFVISNKGIGPFSYTQIQNPEILLSKVSHNGTFVWTKDFALPPLIYQYAKRILVLPNGNLAICGVQTTNSSPPTDSLGLILITDTSGNVLHQKTYSLGGGTSFNDLIVSLDNKIILCGISAMTSAKNILLVKTDFNGDSIWTKKYSYNYQYLDVNSLVQMPTGKIIIGGGEPGISWENTFYHCVDSSANQVLFHTRSHVICDASVQLQYSKIDYLIYCADDYSNFGPHLAFQAIDTLGNGATAVSEFLEDEAYSWGVYSYTGYATAISLVEDFGNYNDYITLTGSTFLSNNGSLDIAIVRVGDSWETKCHDHLPAISPKTSVHICPGDSVLITLDSNSYIYSHWINIRSSTGFDLGVYNDSIWVRDSGYYYMISMDQDSSIWISNQVRVYMTDTIHPVITANGNLNFCMASGQILSLSVAVKSDSHYQWYLNNTILTGDTTGYLNVTLSGNYFCRRINTCGFFDSDTVTVNTQYFYNSFNYIQTSGPFQPWCSPPNEILSVTPPSGTGYHYGWYHNNVLIPGSDHSSLGNILSDGFYSCVIYSPCGTDSFGLYLWTAQLPSISSSGNLICAPGDSLELIVSSYSPYYNSIQWYRNQIAIPGATSGWAYATQNGDYFYEMMINNCFNSPIHSDTITISTGAISLPPISLVASDTLICNNQQVTLSANSTIFDGSIYLRKNGVILNANTNGYFYINQPGIYDVFDKSPCDTSYSNTITITQFPVIPLSLGNDTIVCNTQSVLLDAGSSFLSYLWNTGDTTESITAWTNLAINDTNEYYVHVIDTNNCRNADTIIVVFDICAGEHKLVSDNNFIIYPNPFSEYTNIYADENFISRNSFVDIYNIYGEKIYSFPFLENPYLLSGERFFPGVYMCVFNNVKGNFSIIKLIVN